MEARYPFVALDVSSDLADEISGLFFELGASGVEERDDQTLKRGAGEGRVTLVASFGTHDEAHEAMASLRDYRSDFEPRLEEIVGDAWRDAWKEHFAPFAITDAITVVPPWVEYKKRESERILELEPGRAFGTGLHATTALIATYLDQVKSELKGKEVLDIGTGSGILALVALLYGAERAECIDNDDTVVQIVLENAARNGLSDKVRAYAATADQIHATYPWVLANIETRVLLPIAEDIVRTLAKGGKLVLSGVLTSEHDAIVERYTTLSRKLRYETTLRREESPTVGWVAIAFSDAS